MMESSAACLDLWSNMKLKGFLMGRYIICMLYRREAFMSNYKHPKVKSEAAEECGIQCVLT